MNYWIFQGNSKSYNFDTSHKRGLLNEWNIQAHVKKIKKGDKAVIWISGQNAGCYGLVDIESDPAVMGKSEDYDQWNADDKAGQKHQEEDKIVHKVRMKFSHNLFELNKPILRDTIPFSNGLLEKLKKGIRGTNFASSKEEYEMVLNLIEKS